MGNYSICGVCGNLYERANNRMCHDCDKIYRDIRDIVEAKPQTIVLELSTQTGISVSKILSFVKNGFFTMNEGTMKAK